MELPKVDFKTGSSFLLSFSIYLFTILLFSVGLFYLKYNELELWRKSIFTGIITSVAVAFILILKTGVNLLTNEDKQRRVRWAIERDILLREYWIKCIEYNQKAKEYKLIVER